MDNKNKKDITRRNFFRIIGTAGAVTAGLTACGGRNSNTTGGEIPTDKMTYRTNPKTGDKVSLLGFGMECASRQSADEVPVKATKR